MLTGSLCKLFSGARLNELRRAVCLNCGMPAGKTRGRFTFVCPQRSASLPQAVGRLRRNSRAGSG